MWEWGLSDLGDTVELIVSELATNAVRASRDPAGGGMWEEGAGLPYIRLRLSSDKRQVLVDVWDRNPQRPTAAAPDSESESGRGLFLVAVVSDRWGYYFPAKEPAADDSPARGKVVWALVGTALLKIPGQHVPGQHVPGQHIPGQHIPGSTFPAAHSRQHIPARRRGGAFPGRAAQAGPGNDPAQPSAAPALLARRRPFGQVVAVILLRFAGTSGSAPRARASPWASCWPRTTAAMTRAGSGPGGSGMVTTSA
jgi:hypothetical protein